MTFIGIVAKQKEFEILQSRIEKQKEINIILITVDNIENLQNIKFNTIIINIEMPNWHDKKIFENICKNAKYIVVNTDKNKNIDILEGKQKTIITYGLNHKSTITVSSIKEDCIMVAIQREFINIQGKLQEIEEERVKRIRNLDIYGHIVLVICNILYGKFTKN